MRKKTRRQLVVELDDLTRRICRLRDKGICQRCGRSDGRMNCSHVVPRTYSRLRWNPANVKLLCFQCHIWWHENPIDAAKWFKQAFPERYATIIESQREGLINWKNSDLEIIRDNLISALGRVR